MAEFIRYTTSDGTEVYFEAADGQLVDNLSGKPDVTDGGKLGDRLSGVAAAASDISQQLRQNLHPDEVELNFGIKVSSKVNFWCLAKADGESSINVKLTWRSDADGSTDPDLSSSTP